MEGLERQLNEVTERNREEELRMRKERGRVESTLSSKIAQYDEDMAARRQMLESLQAAFEVETSEYASLKEYFDKVDADLYRQEEEEDILAAVARREEYGDGVLTRAAVLIQKIARAKRARAEVAKIRAKKNKGKKKGKKATQAKK